MRVLMVCEYGTLNGGEHSMLSVVPLLQEQGVRFAAVAPGQGELAERLCRYGIPVFDLESTVAEQHARAARVQIIQEAMTEWKPDVVHANSLSMSRIVGCGRRSWRTRTIGHVRDIVKLSAAAARDIATNDQVLTVSIATRCHLIDMGVPEEKIRVVYNGIDSENFRPRPSTKFVHRQLGLSDDVQFVSVVGQLGMRKGVDDALSALAMVAVEFPHVHMLVVGERHSSKDEALAYEKRLYEIADTPPLVGRVHFLGRRSDVNLLLNESDLVLHLAHQEPLGRVLLEAAASGCCVLASDVGGTSEIFPPAEFPDALTGRADPRQAAERLRLLLSNAAKRGEIAQRMARRVQTHFRREASAERLLQQYQEVAGM